MTYEKAMLEAGVLTEHASLIVAECAESDEAFLKDSTGWNTTKRSSVRSAAKRLKRIAEELDRLSRGEV